MKKTTKQLRLFICATILAFVSTISGQEYLSPLNNEVASTYINNEEYVMRWSMVQDSSKIEIAEVFTKINVQKETLLIVTEVDMRRASEKWIDSTIVNTKNFQPIYHSSFNQQRDIVLKYDRNITGYYFDKKTAIKTQISEFIKGSYYDSSFYHQLLRWLPSDKENYSKTIAIFNYDPNSKTGLMTATIKSVDTATIKFNGKDREVWKFVTTDDISNNTIITTSFIEIEKRKLLKQQIDVGPRTMLMELIE